MELKFGTSKETSDGPSGPASKQKKDVKVHLQEIIVVET